MLQCRIANAQTYTHRHMGETYFCTHYAVKFTVRNILLSSFSFCFVSSSAWDLTWSAALSLSLFNTHTQACMHARTHACTRVYTHKPATHTHICEHTLTHTCIACAYTYTYAHTHTCLSQTLPLMYTYTSTSCTLQNTNTHCRSKHTHLHHPFYQNNCLPPTPPPLPDPSPSPSPPNQSRGTIVFFFGWVKALLFWWHHTKKKIHRPPSQNAVTPAQTKKLLFDWPRRSHRQWWPTSRTGCEGLPAARQGQQTPTGSRCQGPSLCRTAW